MKLIFENTFKSKIKYTWQPGLCHYIAIQHESDLFIHDRIGECIDTIPLNGDLVVFEWSPDGKYVASTQSKSSQIILWNASQRKIPSQPLIETKLRNVDYLLWLMDNVLLIGNSKGNILIWKLDELNFDPVPLIGKHSKSIVTGSYHSNQNVIALASLDKTVSVSNLQGDTLFQFNLKGEPSHLLWNTIAIQESINANVMSLVVNRKTLLLHDGKKFSVELSFPSKYGSIVNYQSFGKSMIAIGFESGYMSIISTDEKIGMGKEIYHVKNHKDSMNALTLSYSLNQLATCGDDCIRIHNLEDVKQVHQIITLDEDRGNLEELQWTKDGQFLTISTKTGKLKTFLSRLPNICSTWNGNMTWLTSVSDIVVFDSHKKPILQKKIGIEPSLLGLGRDYLVAGMNNKCHFIHLSSSSVQIKEYVSTLKQIVLNENYAAVLLSEGTIQIHSVHQDQVHPLSKTLTASNNSDAILSIALNSYFLVYGTENGYLVHYSCEDWNQVSQFQHSYGIKYVYPETLNGVKTIFIDSLNHGYVFNAVNGQVYKIPEWPSDVQGVLWNSKGGNLFICWNPYEISSFALESKTLKGQECVLINSIQRPFSLKPVLYQNGNIDCISPSGKLDSLSIHPHILQLEVLKLLNEQEQSHYLISLYYYNLMDELWSLTSVSRRVWTIVGEFMLRILDLKTAKRIYSLVLSDVGMSMTLDRIRQVENLNELLGHVSVIFNQFDAAQEYFLESDRPIEALYLRHDLRQWKQALSLAQKLSSNQVTVLSKEYAQQLESDGNYSESLRLYEQALATSDEYTGDELDLLAHKESCLSGLTRTCLHLGDISRGMRLLNDRQDPQLIHDCSQILEDLKQYQEAGTLLERIGKWDKAGWIWIKSKNWNRLSSIVEKVTNLQILGQYAKARQVDGFYKEAANAYERAQEYDNLVSILIEQLKDITRAIQIVRNTHSRESAKLIVKFFQEKREYKPVIEFCLLAGMEQEAFEIAQQYEFMEYYADLVKDEASFETLMNISTYFENKGQFGQAAKYNLLAGNYQKALRFFLKASATETMWIDEAIKTVGVAKSDALTHELINFLMGEVDGIPRDAKYIFQLYMSLGQFKEASRTAVIIAREEQALGNYKTAHDLLMQNYIQLQKNQGKIPLEMDRLLMLIHSYLLVKVQLKLDNHIRAARLLVRISNNISKFPSHIVPILTSTVIECYRSGLKKSAFEQAAILMRPENKIQLDSKFKKKIEQIIRRPEQEELAETLSPCPFCNHAIPDMQLECDECKNILPFCIITGQHMVVHDWSECPDCHFPALYSVFKEYLTSNTECPMCHSVHIKDISLMTNAQLILKSQSDSIDTKAQMAEPAPELGLKRTEKSLVSSREDKSEFSLQESISNPGFIMNEFNAIGGMAI